MPPQSTCSLSQESLQGTSLHLLTMQRQKPKYLVFMQAWPVKRLLLLPNDAHCSSLQGLKKTLGPQRTHTVVAHNGRPRLFMKHSPTFLIQQCSMLSLYILAHIRDKTRIQSRDICCTSSCGCDCSVTLIAYIQQKGERHKGREWIVYHCFMYTT